MDAKAISVQIVIGAPIRTEEPLARLHSLRSRTPKEPTTWRNKSNLVPWTFAPLNLSSLKKATTKTNGLTGNKTHGF